MPVTPSKRKAADAQHAARAAVQPSPFKQRKLDSELSVEVKRCLETDKASNRRLNSKVYDAKTIRTVPGGFEIEYSADGSGGFTRRLRPMMMAVPSTLANHIREQVLHAATTRSNKFGKTSAERMQGRFKEMMKMYAEKGIINCNLVNMTDDDEDRVLNSGYTSRAYTCLGPALRDFPVLIDTMSVFNGKAAWSAEASTLETKADGQMSVVFKTSSGRAIMKVSFKEIHYV